MVQKSQKKVINKKRRIRYKSIILLVILASLFFLCIYNINTLKIKNIYIEGNSLLTDQQIIDEAGLHDYPSLSKISSTNIKKELEDVVYIKKAKVKLRNLMREIDITIEENPPLIYYEYDKKYLLADGRGVDDNYNLPVLINQTPEDILLKLLKNLSNLDNDILNRISEIRYYPSNVDDELFYLTMTDGNYVYINFNSFSKLNNYVDIIKNLDNKKGIVHLDSGDYLEIFE